MTRLLTNRALTIAAIALVAGIAAPTPSVNADTDWSLSLNLGWGYSDPFFTPAPVYTGWYSGWYSGWGSYYSRPWYYRPVVHTPIYYSPWYGGYYTEPAFVTPLYSPASTTVIYSNYNAWGSGYTYTHTSYYSPWGNYYAPASPWYGTPGWGLTFTFGNNSWGGHNDWRWRADHRRDDRNHWNDRAREHGRDGRSNSFPRATTYTNPNPNGPVRPMETRGTAGPAVTPASPLLATKEPRPVAPVAVKPIESRPAPFPTAASRPAPRPSLPTLTQIAGPVSKPTAAGSPANGAYKPTPANESPRLAAPESPRAEFPTSKPPGTLTDKPSPVMPTAKPVASASGKPLMPAGKPLADAPQRQPLPTLRPAPMPFAGNDRADAPTAKPPTAPAQPAPVQPADKPFYRNSGGYDIPQRAPQQPQFRQTAPMPAPSAKPMPMPAAKPPAPAPAPMPRASAPAPAPRPAAPAPMPSGKGGGSGHGNKRG